jgi:prepilin-type N-terminal cleavage/methylation domain-containing protein
MDKKLTNLPQNGFSLLEVLMALTIFSFFITAFMMSQGHNITTSTLLAEDIKLHNLAEMKINEVLLDPPEFTNATENDVESKNFTMEDYKQYKYTVEYKKLEIPDFSKLSPTTPGEDEPEPYGNEESVDTQAIEKMVYDKLKKNMEEILWQVKVTVINTETDYSYELSTWIINEKARIDTNFGF